MQVNQLRTRVHNVTTNANGAVFTYNSAFIRVFMVELFFKGAN